MPDKVASGFKKHIAGTLVKMQKSTAKLAAALAKTNNLVAKQQIKNVMGAMEQIVKAKKAYLADADRAAFGKAMRPLHKQLLGYLDDGIKKVNAQIPKIKTAKEKKILKGTLRGFQVALDKIQALRKKVAEAKAKGAEANETEVWSDILIF